MAPDHNTPTITQLYPAPVKPVPLHRHYLNESLRPSGTPDEPCVYASFITSLDGRISLPDPETGTRKVPQATANPRDWRLFQELAASAEMVVTTGRYIRELAAGAAQSSLPISDKPKFADLHEWRSNHGLAPQPDVAIVTDSLNLPIPDSLLQSERKIYVAVGAEANPAKLETFKDQGVQILKAGKDNRIEGRALVETLGQEGYGTIDMIAGGQLLRTLLADRVFTRLYLTQACRMLGGSSFDTLLKGQQFNSPADFELNSLFYDTGTDELKSQLFAVLDYQQ